jgi:hypothetical protein
MPKQNYEHFPAKELFPQVEWRDGQEPMRLQFDPHSRFVRDADDPMSLYAIRISKHDIPLESATAGALYNGSQPGEKWNATEGHGLYLTNAPRTDRVVGIRHDHKYVARVQLGDDEILSAHGNLNRLETGQKLAAMLLRARGIVPGIPNPGTNNWDKLYGDAKAVSYPPIALARPYALRVPIGGGQTVGQQWMVLRDPSRIEIIGKYLPKN